MGFTTPGNPILEFAYELFLKPIGLKCDAFIYDALGAVEDESIIPAFASPSFDVDLTDPQWQNYSIIEPLVRFRDWIEPIFTEDGYIEGFRYKQELTADDPQPELQNFLENGTDEIINLNAELIQAAKLYIDAAFALIGSEGPEAQDFAKLFIENRRRYPEVVFAILTQQPQDQPPSPSPEE